MLTKNLLAREEFGVEASFFHENFKSKTFDNDIGLLKLSRQARLDIFTPVCLPSRRMTEGGVSVWITGEVVIVNCYEFCIYPLLPRMGSLGGEFLADTVQIK